MQRELTIDEVREVVSRVHYEKGFRVDAHAPGVWYLQIEYEEPDIRTGEMSVQRGRKWYVSRFATESEIVQTCLRAALDSAEHQVREHFAYLPEFAEPGDKPLLIYGPHFDAGFLWTAMNDAGRRSDELDLNRENIYDAREDPE